MELLHHLHPSRCSLFHEFHCILLNSSSGNPGLSPFATEPASGSNYPRAEVNLAIRSYNYGQIFINGISFRILGSFPHTPELLALRTPPLVKVSVCYAREENPERSDLAEEAFLTKRLDIAEGRAQPTPPVAAAPPSPPPS